MGSGRLASKPVQNRGSSSPQWGVGRGGVFLFPVQSGAEWALADFLDQLLIRQAVEAVDGQV